METIEFFAFSKAAITTYGIQYVLNNLRQDGYDVQPFNPGSKNTVLVSLYWQEQLYPFLRWRYSSPMKGRRVIVGGNYPTTSPNSFINFDCDVFMGDGELFQFRENKFMASEGGPKKRAIAEKLNPFAYTEIQKSPRALCEISRGCKNKCLFCQYTWLKPYREVDINKIKTVLSDVKTSGIKMVRCFAADKTQHSGFSEINSLVSLLELADISCDVTLKGAIGLGEKLKEMENIQVGLEGMSEGLRLSVNKPITDKEVEEFLRLCADSGKKAVQIYMIYGLPGEQDSDVDCFENLISRIDKILPKNFVICLHWNAFQPNAQTPFQWAAAAIEPRGKLKEFWRKKINQNIRLLNKPTITSSWTMIKRVLAIRMDKSTTDLAYTIAMIGDTRKKYGHLILEKYKEKTGINLMGEWPKDTPLPWDKYVEYKKGPMRGLYEKFEIF